VGRSFEWGNTPSRSLKVGNFPKKNIALHLVSLNTLLWTSLRMSYFSGLSLCTSLITFFHREFYVQSCLLLAWFTWNLIATLIFNVPRLKYVLRNANEINNKRILFSPKWLNIEANKYRCSLCLNEISCSCHGFVWRHKVTVTSCDALGT